MARSWSVRAWASPRSASSSARPAASSAVTQLGHHALARVAPRDRGVELVDRGDGGLDAGAVGELGGRDLRLGQSRLGVAERGARRGEGLARGGLGRGQSGDVGRHGDGCEQVGLGSGLLGHLPLFGLLAGEVVDAGRLGVDDGEQRVQGGDPGGSLGDTLLAGAGELVEAPVEVGELELRLAGALARTLGHPAVDAELEQRDEQVLAVRRLVVEEPGELALGQHDATGEVVVGEPEQLGDAGRDLLGGAGHDASGPLEPGFGGGGAAALGATDHPHRRPGLVGDGEVEAHPRLLAALADGGGDGLLVAQAVHDAVEGEGDGIEDRGLADAGGPGEGEEVDALEVDLDRRPVGREPLELQAPRPHPPTSSSSSSKSAPSRGSSTPAWAR